MYIYLIQGLMLGHTLLGALALFTGSLVILLPKGTHRHKKIGKIFFGSLLLSTLLSCVLSILPEHENIFLFCMGIFTIYLLLAGYRGLGFRQEVSKIEKDKLMALGLGIVGLIMITFPILLYQQPNRITGVFGIVNMYVGLSDLRRFRKPKLLKEQGLYIHLSKTIGAYLAALTAFLVVNNILPLPLANWLLPGALGILYIFYWNQKLRKDTPSF